MSIARYVQWYPPRRSWAYAINARTETNQRFKGDGLTGYSYQRIRWIEPVSLKSDVRITDPGGNFGSSSRARTVTRLGGDITEPSASFPDACSYALSLVRTFGHRRVLHILGGTFRITGWTDEPGVGLHGICFPWLLASAVSEYPSWNWSGSGFVSIDDAERALAPFNDDEPQMVALWGILERLSDPRPLLRPLRRLLRKNPSNRLLLLSIDRERAHGEGFNSMPPDQSCFREWNFEELCRLALSCGLKIERSGHTARDESDACLCGNLLELSCSDDSYVVFLQSSGLPPQRRILRITTEHARDDETGDIGSYERILERAAGEPILTLFVGRAPDRTLDTDIPLNKGLLHPGILLQSDSWQSLLVSKGQTANADVVLQCVEQILFFYDGISHIEYQDYLGVGRRLGQAKAAGLLPSGTRLEVVCHGGSMYREMVSQRWRGLEDQRLLLQEKVSVENADLVRFPSEFLRDRYLAWGYEIDLAKCTVRPYPFFFEERASARIEVIDTLVFIGKKDSNNFKEFTLALKGLARHSCATRMRRLLVLGSDESSRTTEDDWLADLIPHVSVEECKILGQDMIALLRELAPNALLVCYFDEHYGSYLILEAVNASCQLIALDGRAVAETIPPRFHEHFLCPPTYRALADRLAWAIGLDADSRRTLVSDLRNECVQAWQSINARFASGYKPPDSEKVIRLAEPRSEQVSVIVPCFNADFRYMEDMIYGLNNQTLPPAYAVFVNDGSEPGYSDRLRDVLDRSLKVPFKIVEHEKNMGLAAARNSGLEHVTTEYVVPYDADNVMKNDYLFLTVRYLLMNPDKWAVTCYKERFDEGTSWEDYVPDRPRNNPVGQTLILGQLENVFGDAMGAYRVAELKRIGGWDAADLSPVEDRALFLKITALRGKIGIVPRPLFLYRVRKDSLLRASPKFPAQQRLARTSVGHLSLYDAYRLHGIMRSYAQTLKQAEKIARTRNKLMESRKKIRKLQARLEKARGDAAPAVKKRLILRSRGLLRREFWRLGTACKTALKRIARIFGLGRRP